MMGPTTVVGAETKQANEQYTFTFGSSKHLLAPANGAVNHRLLASNNYRENVSGSYQAPSCIVQPLHTREIQMTTSKSVAIVITS